MKIRSLRVEQLRRFGAPFVLDGLEPGLNIVAGPNEAGKSTLVRALRAVFFERYGSKSVDDLQPWGNPAASPRVDLDFEVDGQAHHLTKIFMKGARCVLQRGSEQLDGERAEQYLSERLGFEYAGRGASRAEHWGVPGLLWIEQGRGQDLADATQHAAAHLRQALNAAVGEVVNSAGDEVLEQVRAERDAWLGARGPKGEYAAAIERQREAGARVDELRARVQQYREQVDRLAALREEQARGERERAWEALQRQADEAQERLEALERLDGERRAVQAQSEAQAAQLALLEEQRREQALQAQALADAGARVAATAARLEEARGREAGLRAAQANAAAALAAAGEAEQRAREAAQRGVLAAQVEDMTAGEQRLASALDDARARLAELAGARTRAADLALDAPALAALQALETELRTGELRQEAAATRLRYELEEGAGVALDGEALAGTGERLLSETAEVRLGAGGRLVITPGGANLATLAATVAELRERRRRLLVSLGVDSLAAAEQRQHQQREAQQQARLAEQALSLLAPRGVDLLGQELEELRLRLRGLRERLAAMPEVAEAPALEDAARARAAAAERHDQATAQLRAAEDAVLRLRATHESESRELAQRRAQQEAAAHSRAAEAPAAEAALREALAGHALRLAALREALAAGQPALLRQDLERFRRSAQQSRSRQDGLRADISRLEGQLETAGADGLEEQLAAAEARQRDSARHEAALALRVRALEHLAGLLEGKRAELNQRLQAPLQRHLNHYLPLLYPGARIELDEHLVPSRLVRPGGQGQEIGEFGEFSFGAREQMGLLSRLAYADLLREAGRPTLIVLDDALVHSDSGRLAQMKRILYDAAQRHQVLLFTCHPEDWQDMGVAVRTLAAAATA